MIGDNIRKYRKASNMSQDELAEKLDVTRQSISLWENGQTQPSLDNIMTLAKLFGVTTDDLLSEDNTPFEAGGVLSGLDEPKPKSKKGGKIALIICITVVILAVLTALGIWKFSDQLGIDIGGTSTETSNSAIEKESLKISAPEKISSQKAASSTVKKSSTKKSKKSSNSASKTASKKTKSTASKPAQKDLYGTIKKVIFKLGETSGDCCMINKTAPTYGGEPGDNFSVTYWASDDEISVCMTYALDETYCLNTYLFIPKKYSGKYEYISSYNYIDGGQSVYEASGTVNASSFTKKTPLPAESLNCPSDVSPDFTELCRQSMCSLIGCMKNFLKKENVGLTLKDFGFTKF